MTPSILSTRSGAKGRRCASRDGFQALILLLPLLAILAGSCVSVDEELPPMPEFTEKDYARPLAPGEKALIRIPLEAYPDFSRGYGERADLLKAVDESIAYLGKPSSENYFPHEGVTHDRVLRSLEAFRDVIIESKSGHELDRRIRSEFDVYMSTGCDRRGTVLFTGYCEPIIDARLTKDGRFRYPLYRLPPDLVKDKEGTTLGRRTASGGLEPYPTRRTIDEEGVLEGKGLEIAWVEHPMDAYIIHVQGSATLKLATGEMMKIGYAGKNGHPYSSLGKALVEEGRIPAGQLSLDEIRSYFANNPDELMPYLYRNASYVFFTKHDGGPYGSIGAEVTAYRTIATDKSVFPRASVTFIDTKLPRMLGGDRIVMRPYAGFALDQDTGGAIRSAGRVDVFLGTGKKAERLAGRTRFEGKLYYLFAK